MTPKPNLHTCRYRGCDNTFSVTAGNGGQRYCSQICRRKEVLARVDERRQERIATADDRDKNYRAHPVEGSMRYGGRPDPDR